MGLFDRLAPRRNESNALLDGALAPIEEPVFATKALRKFLQCLTSRESPVLLDLGPVVGSNVGFFGEQLGCKSLVEDIFADLDRHVRSDTLDDLPAFLKQRLTMDEGSVDGVLCWDVMDYLDRPAAQELAMQLKRVLRPDGALLAFFGTAAAGEGRYTKFIIVDEVNLKYRPYPALRGRRTTLLNRDVIRLFDGLRVSDSFLLQNNIREVLFRKPA